VSIARSIARPIASPIASRTPIIGGGGGVPPNPAYQILVKTDNAGSSTSTQFTLPATGSYTVDWGDDVVESLSGAQTHTYATAGSYVIRVTGGLTAITFNNGGDRLKLLEIQNWGAIAWSTLAVAYFGCANMQITATDAPNLSGVTSLDSTFRACTAFNSSINNWDVSTINVFNGLFRSCTNFNQSLNAWNTGSVTNMNFCFTSCTAFNGDISSWNTANVTGMQEMFASCSNFNANIGGWNVAKVTNLSFMFSGAAAFDQNLGSWNVSAATNVAGFMATKTPATFSATNLDEIYNGWSSRPVVATRTISFGTAKHTAAGQAGRDILTGAPNNWSITDGGL
jgi:surface protein